MIERLPENLRKHERLTELARAAYIDGAEDGANEPAQDPADLWHGSNSRAALEKNK